MYEIGEHGTQTSAFNWLVIIYVIFIYCCYVYFKPCIKESVRLKDTSPFAVFDYVLVAFACIIVMISCGFVFGVANGFALLEGVNRFGLRENESLLLVVFLNNKFFAVFCLASIYINKTGNIKLFSLFLFTFYALVLVLNGEQFLSLISFLSPMILAFLYSEQGSEKSEVGKVKKNAKSSQFLFFMAIALGVSTTALAFVYTSQGYDFFEKIEERFILQGQMLYLVVSNSDFYNWDSLIAYLANFYQTEADFMLQSYVPTGMREVMFKYATPSVFKLYIENGVTFTMGQAAMLLYYFGPILFLIPLALSAILFSSVLRNIFIAIVTGDLVLLLATSKLFTWIYFGLQQGEYWYLFNLKILLLFQLYIFTSCIFPVKFARNKDLK